MKKFQLFSVVITVLILTGCGGSEPQKSNQNDSISQNADKDVNTNEPTVVAQPPLNIDKTFIPCGWMGDGEKGKQYITIFDRNCNTNPHTTPTCIKISYKVGPEGWAGIYWLNKDKPCNWGDEKGIDLSKKGYTKITFWVRGLKGGESVQFKAGGVNKKTFKDSFDYEPKLSVDLTTGWTMQTINLGGQDLSNVIGGFCWVANSSVTFFLDDIQFE